jgi:hypothetical protein
MVLHIFIFPFPGQGHIIPLFDIAKLLSSLQQEIKITFIDTDYLNISSSNLNDNITIVTIKFPFIEAGLPQGCTSAYLSSNPHLQPRFWEAIDLLQKPLELLLEEHRPGCLISDMFFPWTTESAAKFQIPRIVFHGTGLLPLCASEIVRLHAPHSSVSSDDEPFLIPYLPDEIELTRKKLPEFATRETDFTKFFEKVKESELKSFGVIVNSFYKLEPAYADMYRGFLGRKAWCIGPVSLCNREIDEKMGKTTYVNKHECLKWLDSKKPKSVVYICFGSTGCFTDSQLVELATGLEAAGQDFVWVVNKESKIPEGFEERMEGKGLIIRGWAPQVMILDHESVGGFVTHCGWNSLLEGVSAGVTMVTWPLAAEQFYNEKLLTQVLGIGVAVGTKQWIRRVGDFVKRDAVTNAIRAIMVGDEAEGMRSRAMELKQSAYKAVEKGGSSFLDMLAFVQEFRT